MRLREWLPEMHSDRVALDEYDEAELELDERRLAHKRDLLAEEIEELRSEFHELIEDGADADGEERERYALDAKAVKSRRDMKYQRYERTGRELAAVLVITAARRLLDAADGDDGGAAAALDPEDDDPAFDPPSPEAVDYGPTREWLLGRLADYDIDREVLEEVQSELGIEILPSQSTPESVVHDPLPHPPDDGVDLEDFDLDLEPDDSVDLEDVDIDFEAESDSSVDDSPDGGDGA